MLAISRTTSVCSGERSLRTLESICDGAANGVEGRFVIRNSRATERGRRLPKRGELHELVFAAQENTVGQHPIETDTGGIAEPDVALGAAREQVDVWLWNSGNDRRVPQAGGIREIGMPNSETSHDVGQELPHDEAGAAANRCIVGDPGGRARSARADIRRRDRNGL